MTTPELTDAVRALARISRVLERSLDELSFADYRVLSAIASGEARASRLAQRLALGKPAISASVDSLCRRGILERSGVEGDNRAVALSLTPNGVALFERTEGRMVAELEALAARTPQPQSVLASISMLGEAIERTMAERAAERARA